jgi:hypothetical protein
MPALLRAMLQDERDQGGFSFVASWLYAACKSEIHERAEVETTGLIMHEGFFTA